MAVILYKKDGQSIIVPPDRLQANLDSGWLLVNPDKEVNNGLREKEEEKKTAKEIRQYAKLAGFEDWKTAKLADLKQKLGYE